MPYDLKEVAAISGMPGLYRLLKPTRAGVIIESLDAKATRSVASARNKVSLLHEISIYTQDYDQTVPLTEVFDRIHQKYGAELPLSNKSDDRDLTAFMGEIIPDYDRDRVYMSDIKKLVTWYRAVSSTLEYQAPATDGAEATEEATPTEATKAAKQDVPANDEAMSTAGIIPATEEDNAAANPEAATPKTAKKASKKA
ncbi:DUF5606 domain-containing protein [Hymenobacter taeanensis]|uniref:DUF5606 domain-containing protein n=1 Tax=Hymenobacter taeanensis TaxID=2735321 RepID=A0A6M6BK17_9BACT|nr:MULTISPECIES: DUF5606 domain-containing protein [Hymenobacter]QJX48400.1 DUF5606 domain-containing protein [Hymenobacter taeanensis]UOQ82106.1 DUF5606 domain-containing protein [Hymenobacter sp. 5414T-23]